MRRWRTTTGWRSTSSLRKYGYPPDKQERATLTVLEQAEVLCAEWAVE